MARFVSRNYEVTQAPAWIGDWLTEDAIVRGGVNLDASEFPLVDGRRFVASGTVVGRTTGEMMDGDPFGPVEVDDGAVTDDQVYIVIYDVWDAAELNEAELYRHGKLVKVNYLPGYDDLDASVHAVIAANYEITTGA